MNCIETQAMSLKLHVSMAPHHPSIPAPSGESAVSAAVAHKRCTSLQVVNSQTHRDVHSSRILTTYSGFCGLRNSQLQPDCLDRFLKRGAKAKPGSVVPFYGRMHRHCVLHAARHACRLDSTSGARFTLLAGVLRKKYRLYSTVQYSTVPHLTSPSRGNVVSMSLPCQYCIVYGSAQHCLTI